MNKKSSNHKSGERRSRSANRWIIAILLLVLMLFFAWILTPRSPVETSAEPVVETSRDSITVARPVQQSSSTTHSESATTTPAVLTPVPVQFTKKTLLDKAWNSEPEALGRFTPMRDGVNEGAIIGPTALVCIGDSVFVLDNNDPNHRRLAVYDANGGMTSSVPLPGGLTWADLVVDPSDSSLFVIDHALSRIYKVKGGEVIEMGRVSLRDFSLGMLFGYDEGSETLYVRDREQNGDVPILIKGQPVDPSERTVQTLSPVWGDFDPENNYNLLLNFKDGQNLAVAFDRPVESVDEMTMDQQGRVWVIFTLEGDYRVRRLAVVDPMQKTVGVEFLVMHFPFENIRRIAPMGDGVVIVSGDDENGRLSSYHYSGNL